MAGFLPSVCVVTYPDIVNVSCGRVPQIPAQRLKVATSASFSCNFNWLCIPFARVPVTYLEAIAVEDVLSPLSASAHGILLYY